MRQVHTFSSLESCGSCRHTGVEFDCATASYNVDHPNDSVRIGCAGVDIITVAPAKLSDRQRVAEMRRRQWQAGRHRLHDGRRTDPGDFLDILQRHSGALVVHATGGFFKTNYKYLTSYKGLAFFTVSTPSTCLQAQNLYRLERSGYQDSAGQFPVPDRGTSAAERRFFMYHNGHSGSASTVERFRFASHATRTKGFQCP